MRVRGGLAGTRVARMQLRGGAASRGCLPSPPEGEKPCYTEAEIEERLEDACRAADGCFCWPCSRLHQAHTRAANYLDIKGLLDLTCQSIADMVKEKTPEEIRKMFNIKNDLTLEEEERLCIRAVVG